MAKASLLGRWIAWFDTLCVLWNTRPMHIVKSFPSREKDDEYPIYVMIRLVFVAIIRDIKLMASIWMCLMVFQRYNGKLTLKVTLSISTGKRSEKLCWYLSGAGVRLDVRISGCCLSPDCGDWAATHVIIIVIRLNLAPITRKRAKCYACSAEHGKYYRLSLREADSWVQIRRAIEQSNTQGIFVAGPLNYNVQFAINHRRRYHNLVTSHHRHHQMRRRVPIKGSRTRINLRHQRPQRVWSTNPMIATPTAGCFRQESAANLMTEWQYQDLS